MSSIKSQRSAKSQRTARRSRRRELGSYYTPAFIARFMLDRCLQDRLAADARFSRKPLRILDPACGDGAFLLTAFDCLCGSHSRQPNDNGTQSTDKATQVSAADRLRIVRDHLFGVDCDSGAIAVLQQRLFEQLQSDELDDDLVLETIDANIRCGDALTGPDFTAESRLFEYDDQFADEPAPLTWSEAFPQVAEQGGFDVVIGNPPYLRELDSKESFDRVARSPLGRRWRQARMDLWFYFVHRGIDLLAENGYLSFIVNSYWTASSGAGKLTSRLERETGLEEVVLLGDAPVFDRVAGRHLIFRLRRGKAAESCRVVDLSESARDLEMALQEHSGRARLLPSRNMVDASGSADHPGGSAPSPSRESQLLTECGLPPRFDQYDVPRGQLFRQGRLCLSKPDPLLAGLEDCSTLGESFEVRQGIAENPPSINARLNRRFDDRFTVGEGVFVLTPDEVESLGLSARERSFLRPFYRTASIGRYSLPETPTHFILYLTRGTAKSLDDCPALFAHLSRFRPITERRRETRLGLNEWWHLHWPRQESIFTEPRILSVQMGSEPQFAYAERPTFVGFSINLILKKSGCPAADLPVLTGILNSELARRWFSCFAKHRGAKLEINGGLLKQFPLPDRYPEIEGEISRCVRKRAQETGAAKIDKLEVTLNGLVDRMYDIDRGIFDREGTATRIPAGLRLNGG